jgi:hypothetical protein
MGQVRFPVDLAHPLLFPIRASVHSLPGASMTPLPSALAWSVVAALACAGPARAALDFHTYRIQKNTLTVLRDGERVDSAYTSFELTRLGSVSLEGASLTLTSHGGYVSVVEEATLTGNVEKRPQQITYDFLFQGYLPIPPLAAVHGLTVFHGDTAYSATLRKQVYSLDEHFLDTLELKGTLDDRVAFLQQLADRSFEATFSKLSLGEPVRVRLEYDLPFTGAPGAELRVPVLFHPSGAAPRQAHITFFEGARGLPAMQWLGPSGRVTLDDKGTHTLDYQSAFVFRRDEDTATLATLQTTGFAGGSAKGEYMLLKAGLNDSLMDVLSRPLEVSFLWRWNPPYDLVVNQDGLKTLSAKGRLAAAEADAIKKVILAMASHGHRFGLMHSIAGKEAEWFPPAAEGSDGYQALLAYLEGFTEQRIYAGYRDYRDPRPDWAATAWKDSGEIAASRKEFLSDLARIRSGFSARTESMKHIEILGLGTAPASEIDLKEPLAVEAVLDSVTISHVMGSWLGVDMAHALAVKANANLRPVEVPADLGFGPLSLSLPVFRPTSVEYRVFSGGRSYAMVMPFANGAGREAVIKAVDPFDDSLELQGIDALGRKTRVHILSPRIQRDSEDMGMARLWAADPDRIAERDESELGMRYGILTKGTFLSAGVGEGTVSPEIVAILPRSVRAAMVPGFRRQGDALRLDPPARLAGAWIDVFDMRGRWLGRLDLEAFRSGSGFLIPLRSMERFGAGRVVLMLRGTGQMPAFSLVLGGRP